MYSAAMLPPAPGLLSTMTVRLTRGRSFSAKYRTITSAPLPAGNAQIRRMSWLGYSCARIPVGTTESAKASSSPGVAECTRLAELTFICSSLDTDAAIRARTVHCGSILAAFT